MSSTQRRPIYASGKWEVDLSRRELRARGKPVPIGGRAFEIVEVLVKSAGQLVSKDELIDRVWKGLEENALQAHISTVRKSLGADRELLQTVSRRGNRLLGPWIARDGGRSAKDSIDLDTEHPSLRSLGSNLLAPTSGLAGREIAAKQVQELVSADRAVTLTGTGGIGKTSLTLEVARGLPPSFDGEGWFVELNALSDPSPPGTTGVASLRAKGRHTHRVTLASLLAAFGRSPRPVTGTRRARTPRFSRSPIAGTVRCVVRPFPCQANVGRGKAQFPLQGRELMTINRRAFSAALAAGAAASLISVRGLAASPTPVKARNIVLVHGLFADGSCWSEVIARLQAAGLNATAVQNPLTTLPEAVGSAQRVLGRQDGPAVLVGHSFSGMIVTEAGVHPNVSALVYVAARAPDAGEDYTALARTYPTPPATAGIVFDGDEGRLSEEAFLRDFAGDLPEAKAKVLYAVQEPFHKALLTGKTTHAAWRSKPSFYAVSTEDRTINPDLERFMAKRMGAKTIEVKASHLSLISHPDEITQLILEAAGQQA